MMNEKDTARIRAYPPEVVLAEMLAKEFGMNINPEQLRAWLMLRWNVISSLAHSIHHHQEWERRAKTIEHERTKMAGVSQKC